jgi:hypothetical protein
MSALDPSYLRSIRDGILSGNIEANNTEALPDGLVGLYDKELFPPTLKWKERKETLDFFLVFALAQKEISADFAAEILGDVWYNHADENSSKEEKRLLRVIELIQVHSKRFSSAGGGKYRLYHERFRVYVLQKVSQQDIAQFNARFIALCETALETTSEKDIPEKECYGLEFISTHFFIGAMQGKTECLNKEYASALKKYAYDQQFWERQIKTSKEFEWSKKMLNQMMSWASKFNEDEEVIECALNKVDLYHQEQNDAPRIVQLVADGDIETALERIEKFGGDDKEGLQRKFILYMLCLMELTLLDSKDKDHAKSSIERILKHLDENIPAHQPDLINWNDFFPSYLFLLISDKLQSSSIKIDIIMSRTDSMDFKWINKRYPYTENQLCLIVKCFETYGKSEKSTSTITDIAKVMLYHNHTDDAIKFIYQNLSGSDLAVVLSSFSTELWLANQITRANELISDAKNISNVISNDNVWFGKNEILSSIAINLAKQRKFSEAIELTGMDIKNCMNGITLRSTKINTLLNIAIELVKSGNIDQAIEITKLVGEDDPILLPLAEFYIENGNISKALELTDKVEFEKSEFLRAIVKAIENKSIVKAVEVVYENDDKEAFNYISKLTDEMNIFSGFIQLAEVFHYCGKYESCHIAIEKSRDCLRWGVFSIQEKANLRLQLLNFLKTNKLDQFDYELDFILRYLESTIIENEEIGLKLSIEFIDSVTHENFIDLSFKLIYFSLKPKINLKIKIDALYYLAKNYPCEITIHKLLKIEDQLKSFNDIINKNNFVYFTPFIKMQNFVKSSLLIYFHEKLFSLIDLLSNIEENLASIIKKHLNEVPRKSSGILEAVEMVNLDQKEVLRIININFSNEKLIFETLYKYMIIKIFQRKLPQEKLDRYNRTLKLQWAIDIKNQLPN